MKMFRAMFKAAIAIALLLTFFVFITLMAFGFSFLMPVLFAKILAVLIFIFCGMVYVNYDEE